MTDIKTVGVVGAGQMGNGIAQVAAVTGFGVVMSDLTQDALERGVATITRSLDKFVAKGRMTQEDRDAALSRITTTLELEDVAPLAGADLTAVAPRGAPADTARLEQDHVVAALGQVERRGQPGITAADDADIRTLLAFEFRTIFDADRCGRIVAVGIHD